MRMLDFAAFPLWVNIVIFIGAASLVWIAGVRLTAFAKISKPRSLNQRIDATLRQLLDLCLRLSAFGPPPLRQCVQGPEVVPR